MQCLKIKQECPKFKNWLTSCELDAKPSRSWFGRERKLNRFSEASKRTIRELGNIELCVLGEISKTVQCPACSTYAPKGLLYCPWCVCLMPSPEQKRKIKTQFEIMSVAFFTRSETRVDPAAIRPLEGKRRREEKISLCKDGRKMKRVGPLKFPAAGQKNIVVTWTSCTLSAAANQFERFRGDFGIN